MNNPLIGKKNPLLEASTKTALTRNAIPVVLEKHRGKSFSESELFDLLAHEDESLNLITYTELGEQNEHRGVLRGIINKLDEIPVANLGVKRKGNRVYYYYTDTKFDEFVNLATEFITKAKERKCLTIDYLEASEGDIEYVRKAANIIKQLEELAQISSK